ncbi:hypothetical protein C1I98_28410 [Spongiactinospora gelatinilytica]|uniref:ATP-grasp domain-containing protein n=1 Tax=Spongiactinospora gelatinilytica TaxID=2666298 RepID=A0A2W2FE86_9ACTN|nr:hypothetical protein [Spongiactinospora gelatinilytica]PZG33841.1 hypothetical protein C1I98_28410 [Spongiactinospora gelatinilytica]
MAAARAEYKPVQLAEAARIGLAIPRTIITSQPQAAYAWAKNLSRPVVYKPLNGIWHADEGQVRALYTTPIADLSDLLDPAVAHTAQMYQEQIDKAYEARAIVVGDTVLAVQINAGSEQGKIDWRSDYDRLTYNKIDLPDDLRDRLVELHARLHLVYGAVDLICDTKGLWYFLETNQAGEWGWLNLKTGLPVAGAMADVLQKGPQWRR